MTSFICNICGAGSERGAKPPGREVPSCSQCGSTVRLRGLVALLSREIFGVALAIPHMPTLKSVHGIGMSDTHMLAVRLAEKFAYTNTFYHQPPVLDITNPAEADFGRYDFIISSDVMEHVPPPVESAFANLFRLLKPKGLLLLTVPYRLQGETEEHYPDLHQYALAAPGGRTVLVNRKRNGAVEVFENLCFHGGDGSTLEMRVFTEESLKAILAGAGFEARIASEDVPEFGVEHAETWSLPIVARKGRFELPALEAVQAYASAARRIEQLEWELNTIRGDCSRAAALHEQTHREMVRALEDRTASAEDLDRQLHEIRTAQAALQSGLWVKLGRKLGILNRQPPAQ